MEKNKLLLHAKTKIKLTDVSHGKETRHIVHNSNYVQFKNRQNLSIVIYCDRHQKDLSWDGNGNQLERNTGELPSAQVRILISIVANVCIQ